MSDAGPPEAGAGLTEKEKKVFIGRSGETPSNKRKNELCRQRLEKSLKISSYVRFMLEAMKNVGCEVKVDRHLVCEPCTSNALGGFDPQTRQIVLCENSIYSQACMNDTLTHELIHAYDYCRAHVEWDNIKHLACTEIRAANLSGDCFFWKENFSRLRFGFKKHHQKCVKRRAVKSILCVNDVTETEAREAVESVFETCFNDTVPFERIPP